MGKKEGMTMSELIALARKGQPDIPEDFYSETRKFMDSLRKKMEEAREAGDTELEEDLRAKIEKIESDYTKIYNRRMKLVLDAVLKKILPNVKEKARVSELTPEEMDIYHYIMDILEQRRKDLLYGTEDLLVDEPYIAPEESEREEESGDDEENPEPPDEAGEEEVPAPEESAPPMEEPHPEEQPAEPEEEPAVSDDAAAENAERKKAHLVTIRMLDDASFVNPAGDGNMILKKGDVASIDRAIADILIKSRKAEKVDVRW